MATYNGTIYIYYHSQLGLVHPDPRYETGAKSKLFGLWTSPFVQRVHLALKLKGIQYEYVEEDVYGNKSPELLQYNPVYLKVPILLHDSRAIVDSAVILAYIDEVWDDAYPLLPRDAYERAVVRFWHHFRDDKMGPSVRKMIGAHGEEQKAAAEELRKAFAVIEGELRDGFFKGRTFFGGEQIGFLDIIFGCGSFWLEVLQESAGVKLLDKETFPLMHAWHRHFNEHEFVKEISPAREKVLEHLMAIRSRTLPGLAKISTNQQ